MFKIFYKTALLLSIITLLLSCESNLDLYPEDNRLTGEMAFEDPDSYYTFLAKIYAGISLSGQEGPAGQPDLIGLDEGFSNYLRLYWSMQQLPTDEAIIGWDDGTLRDLHYQNWTSSNEFIRTMYARLFYQISLTNEYLRQTTDQKLDERGVDENLRQDIKVYRAEVRFMRALTYWHALDLYANPTFVTEEDEIGAFLPPQIQREDLFNYIESELLAIEDDMIGARQNEYGRADRAALWTLLAKLYLNAEVYTGTPRYEGVIAQTTKVIAAGYSVATELPYTHLFLADNHINGSQSEVIFPIRFDGLGTLSFGGMTFLIHAAVGGNMPAVEFGINGGWGGLRTTSVFVEKFPGEENSEDLRSQFWTDGHTKTVESVGSFTSGYAVMKNRNVRTDGSAGSNPSHPDTDFPMFRLADVYLMYAEAHLRGGGGSASDAVNYINILRQRAYGNSSGNISSADLNLQFILDERSRELYWEAHRRTDLIRFGQLTSQGIWEWKGNVPQGTTTPAFRNIMPIPSNELGVNPNLTQNPGY